MKARGPKQIVSSVEEPMMLYKVPKVYIYKQTELLCQLLLSKMAELPFLDAISTAGNKFTPHYSLSQRVPKVEGSKGRSFVVFSLVHTVTNLIPEILRANPAIHFHGHIFNETEAQALQVSDLGSWTVDTRNERPSDFLRHMLGCTDKLVGFCSRPEDWKYRQDLLKTILNDHTITKVFITGDPLRSYAVKRNFKQREFCFHGPEITAQGIQRFIDGFKSDEQNFKKWLLSSQVLWLNYEDGLSDIEQVAVKLYHHLRLLPFRLPSEKRDLLSKLVELEDDFSTASYLQRNTSHHEHDVIKYSFNLEDVDVYLSDDDSESLIPYPQVPDLYNNSTELCKWALLVPIQSNGREYDKTRLRTFFRKLIASLPPRERNRVIVHFGVDKDDPLRETLRTTVNGMAERIKCPKTILSHQKGHVCSIWNTLAHAAKSNGCDFFVFLGDDVTFETPNWMSSIEEKFHKISFETGLPFGVGCVAFNDISFPNFPTFPVLHRSHLELFDDMFSDRFINQGADPYLFELYNHLGAAVFDKEAVIRNHIGGNSSQVSRYEKHGIRLKNDILTQAVQRLRGVFGADRIIPTMDVVVPTYRLNLDTLETIVSLRVSRPCQVKFWIIVDNPDHPNLLELQTRHDGQSCSGNYTKQVIVHPKNLGASAARNTGIMRSSADWILFLDDDVRPEEDILEHYLSAIFRYPDSDGFAGVTRLPSAETWWQKALKLSGVTTFYQIASHMPYVPWSVSANLCVKGRTNSDVMFQLLYPKSGGGEDVDFCLRLKTTANSIVSVPSAVAHHPWFANNASEAIWHVMKWVTGDSRCVELLPEKTYRVCPGWTEFILFASIPALLCGIFLRLPFTVIVLEILFKSISFIMESDRDSEDGRPRMDTAFFAALILMGQEVIRTYCHLERFCPRAFCRRLDWFDGMVPKATALSQRQHAIKFTVYVVLFCYLVL